MVSDKSMSVLFVVLSITSFALVYLTPPSINALFPAFEHVRNTGRYPDGLVIRCNYVGISVVDELLTGLAGFFSAAVDGHDEATRLFCLWFIPQLCSILVFLFWEPLRGGQKAYIIYSTIFSIFAQLFTAGVVLPLYFAIHIAIIPANLTYCAHVSPANARALLPAIIVGFLVPSAALFLTPANSHMPIETKQIIAAFWQPFPLYIFSILALVSNTLPLLTRDTCGSTNNEVDVLRHLQHAYVFSGAMSTFAHWFIFIPSLVISDSRHSFAHIFVPYTLHHTLGVAPSTLPPYRLAIRLLFQNDWLTMTISALVFFGWTRVQLTRHFNAGREVEAVRLRYWLMKIVLSMTIGGPGLSIAWAALEREKLILGKTTASRNIDSKVGNSEGRL